MTGERPMKSRIASLVACMLCGCLTPSRPSSIPIRSSGVEPSRHAVSLGRFRIEKSESGCVDGSMTPEIESRIQDRVLSMGGDEAVNVTITPQNRAGKYCTSLLLMGHVTGGTTLIEGEAVRNR